MTKFPSWLRIPGVELGWFLPSNFYHLLPGGEVFEPWCIHLLMVKAMVKNQMSQPESSELDLVCRKSPYVLAIPIWVLSAWNQSGLLQIFVGPENRIGNQMKAKYDGI